MLLTVNTVISASFFVLFFPFLSLPLCLQVLFELVLSPHFDVDLLGGAAAAIFSLICTQQVYCSAWRLWQTSALCVLHILLFLVRNLV